MNNDYTKLRDINQVLGLTCLKSGVYRLLHKEAQLSSKVDELFFG